MPVSRHAWWRGRGLMWRGPAWGTDDVAGPAAPPTLARQCRALLRGAARPNIHKQPHHLAVAPATGPGYLDGRIKTRRARILLSFFSRPNREFDKPVISFSSFIIRLCTILTNQLRKIATGVQIRRDCRFPNAGYLISPAMLSRLKETNKKQFDKLPHNIFIVLT